MGTYNVPATSPCLDAELIATGIRAGGLREQINKLGPAGTPGPTDFVGCGYGTRTELLVNAAVRLKPI